MTRANMPRWVAGLWSEILRGDSLRWLAASEAGLLEGRWRRLRLKLRRSVGAMAASWWPVPSGCLLIVVALAVYEPCWPGLCGRAPAVLEHEERAREVLSTIWQVEAGALALVVAAILFAFESALRQRTGMTLGEFASRAGLVQYVMVGASGLLVVGVPLVWTPGRPPVAAASFALLVAGAGLALLPWIVVRSLTVVDETWVREQRLAGIEEAVDEEVRRRSLSLVGRMLLGRQGHVEVTSRFLMNVQEVVEAANRDGEVFDINLRRLRRLAQAGGDVRPRISVSLGDSVAAGATLVDATTLLGTHRLRPVVTVVPSQPDRLTDVVNHLRDEGLEAARVGSTRAMEDVANGYIQLWVAWPRVARRVADRVGPDVLSPDQGLLPSTTDQAGANLWRTLEEVLRTGTRDQLFPLLGVLTDVEHQATELGVLDPVRRMARLAQSIVAMRAGDKDLLDTVVENAWRGQVGACELQAAYPLEHGQLDDLDRDFYISLVALYFRTFTEMLRILHDRERWEDFDKLDHRFRGILEFWRPIDSVPLSRAIVEDPERFGAGTDDVQRARQVLHVEGLRTELFELRRAQRLLVLGWMLHQSGSGGASQWDRIRQYADTLGTTEQVLKATGRAMEGDNALSTWLRLEGPERGVVSLDTNGFILRALVLVLLLRGQAPQRAVVAPWVNAPRIERALALVDELAVEPEVRSSIPPSPDVETTVETIREMLRTLLRDQQSRETRELIGQGLDREKVRTFQEKVVESWSQERIIHQFGELTALPWHARAPEELARYDFGIRTLTAKGLFVTPTNFVGLEHNASEYGRRLAQGEVSVVIAEVIRQGARRGVQAAGGLRQRLEALLAALRDDGYAPSLILTSFEWRRSRALGLPDWREPQPEEGRLGHNVRGWFEGIPVVEWWDVPDDRFFAVDVEQFCHVEDSVRDAEATPPVVSVTTISEERADEITAGWDPLEDEDAEAERRERDLTQVELEITRGYRVVLEDQGAARSVWLPESIRGGE